MALRLPIVVGERQRRISVAPNIGDCERRYVCKQFALQYRTDFVSFIHGQVAVNLDCDIGMQFVSKLAGFDIEDLCETRPLWPGSRTTT